MAKTSETRYFLKFIIDSCPLIVNLWTEHLFSISRGTHTNCFVISLISGIGKIIWLKASKVMERWLQSLSGHLTVLLNCPCIRSTMIDWDLLRCASQDSILAFSSSSPWDSIIGTRGFTFTRFKSSWRESRTILSSSWESYCSSEANCFLNLPRIPLKLIGITIGWSPSHNSFMSFAYAIEIMPWAPNGLDVLISLMKSPFRK